MQLSELIVLAGADGPTTEEMKLKMDLNFDRESSLVLMESGKDS
jgi:hypothetical protein